MNPPSRSVPPAPRWSIALPGSTDHDLVCVLAPHLERLGFRSLWLNDTPEAEALPALARVADVTSSLRLIAGLASAEGRMLDRIDFGGLPADRLVLVTGSMFAARPIVYVANGIAALRARTTAPLLVASMSRQMTELAARAADGVALSWHTPDTATPALAHALDAYRRLGSPLGSAPSEFRRMLFVGAAIDAAAFPALEAEANAVAALPVVDAHLQRLGLKATQTLALSAPTLCAYRGMDELVIRAMTAHGTLAELIDFAEQLAEWRSLPAT